MISFLQKRVFLNESEKNNKQNKRNKQKERDINYYE